MAPSLYALELVEALRAEGHPIRPGTIGENLTVQDLDWSAVVPGAHLHVGMDVVLQITRYAGPCTNIATAFADGDYARVSPKRHAGWSRVYARVRREGVVTVGDPIRMISATQADELVALRPEGSRIPFTRRRGE